MISKLLPTKHHNIIMITLKHLKVATL